jgi:hypothetical protein
MQTEHKKAKMPSNPKYIGAGFWCFLHLLAKHAVTTDKKESFIDNMYLLSVEFPCGNCRNHIQAYLNEHPFEPFMNLTNEKGEEIGMFKWLWMFHNAVNARLHKPIVDWDTAWEMYDTGREVCTNCSVSRNNSPNASRENSRENSYESNNNSKDYEDSFEENHVTYLSPDTNKGPAKSPKRYVDKKAIIQGYFLKKALINNK